MWLLNKKVRGKGIKTFVGKMLPKKIEEPELSELVQRLRNGDVSVKNKIVEGHIRLAVYIASQYATQTNSPEELVNEACYAVVLSVDKAKERLIDNNITPWLAIRVHRYCYKYIVDERRHLASQITIKRHNEAGDSIPDTKVQNETDTVTIDTFTRRTQQLSGKWSTSVRDIKDEVKYAIELEHDADRRILKTTIIRLRTLGYNDQEIALMLHKSPSLISKLRGEIREIFDEIENE